jgi:hypothetical protein
VPSFARVRISASPVLEPVSHIRSSGSTYNALLIHIYCATTISRL